MLIARFGSGDGDLIGARLVMPPSKAKAIVTDSHFLVPFGVLVAGIALLVFLQ